MKHKSSIEAASILAGIMGALLLVIGANIIFPTAPQPDIPQESVHDNSFYLLERQKARCEELCEDSRFVVSFSDEYAGSCECR